MGSKRFYLLLILVLLIVMISFVRDSGAQTIISSITILPENITVIYDEFKQSPATTNFSNMSDFELQAIENMTLENSSFGKIIFLETVNLTEVVENKIVNLDNYVDISDNHIEIDTSHFTNLVKPAKLFLYGLSFTNPRILKDGQLCGEPDCNITNYSLGILEFMTASFSIYKAEETPTNGNGNGNGNGRRKQINFSINKDLIIASINQGDRLRETIIITNTGKESLLFSLNLQGEIGRFVILSEESFSLLAGESKTINVDFFVGNNETGAVYSGSIIVNTGSLSKSVSVVLEVLEKEALFDLKSELFDITLTKIQNLKTKITLSEVSGLGKVNVFLEYFIKDFLENEIKIGEETLEVDGSLEIERTFSLPETLKAGEYVFYVKLSYRDSVATSLNTFKIINVEAIFLLVIFLIILVIVLFSVFLVWYWRRKRTKGKQGGVFKSVPWRKEKVKQVNE